LNIQEYISSGIIESYVLGLASPEERVEFEQNCALYPELVSARTDFEMALEQQALSVSPKPPAFIKEKLMNEISSGAKVVPMKPAKIWKYVAAAAIVLLTGSITWNISQMNQNKTLAANLDKANDNIMGLVAEIGKLQQNPNIKMASLKGMEASPQSYATVYWDTTSHDVFLLANNLPAPPTDKQYQLWALLDGKPVDLGMMEYDIRQKKLLVRMKNVGNAQAFAITLEKMDRPDPSKPDGTMYVMGNL
jgi:anti-sigma-K factor RskA